MANIRKIDNQPSQLIHDEQYQQLLRQVIKRAELFQYRTAIGINQEQIRFYWSIGEDITKARAEAKWGSKFYNQFSRDLQAQFPDRKGFSVRNLQYISQMYRLFASEQIITPQAVAQLPTADSEFTPQAVAQITPIDYISLLPWSHIRYILDKGYSAEKSFYYVLIGLLLCKEKNDLVAQWTVEKSEQPIAITRYELEKLLPQSRQH